MNSGVPSIMQRVSGVINVGEKFVHAVADNINSRFTRVGDEIESGTAMVRDRPQNSSSLYELLWRKSEKLEIFHAREIPIISFIELV